MFLMPSGRVLGAGPARYESFLLNVPFGSAPTAITRRTYSRTRNYGSAVVVPKGTTGSNEVMQVGGFQYENGVYVSTPSSQKIDAGTNSVYGGPSLRTARSHHNVILLPDRSMVSIGGGYGNRGGNKWVAGPEHKPVEILDRGASAWRLGPAQTQKRSYHSAAVLLPDGRVLSAGDESDATSSAIDVAEIYEPAYLHKTGTRPAITAAPAGTTWGATFSVRTNIAISEAVLVAPGANTHSTEMSQRLVPLTVRRTTTGANLVAPSSRNVAPPGYYMLFVLAKGKPSVARWVRLG